MPDDGARARRWRNRLGAGAGLVLLAFALSANSLGAFFVGDDFDFLARMARFENLREVVSFQFWGEWEPLWYASWYLDYRLWGLNPLGYHLTNVLWLAILVVAILGFVRTVWPQVPLAAWAAALLFAVHPVHDEAVIYLSARGHIMGAALAVVALWLYALFREAPARPLARVLLLAGALIAAFLAALGKEVALVLPAWIGACEWFVLRRQRSWPRALLQGMAAGAVFAVPAAGTLGLRWLVVGLESDKLSALDMGDVAGRAAEELPAYALIGGLPLPFALADYPTVTAAAVLGWVLLAAATAASLFALYRCAFRGRPSPVLSFICLGLIVAAVSLLPVFWADLPLRRRYLYTPTVGIVLIAAAALGALAVRSPRLAWGILLALALGGAAAGFHRNDLYRRSGDVARNLLETARGAPLEEPPARRDGRPVVLVTLPRAYGGDFLCGAYLFHHSDLLSALKVFDAPQPRIEYAMTCYHAEDYTVEAAQESNVDWRLRVSFRSRRAFDAALARDTDDDRRGNSVSAALESADAESLVLTYRLNVPPRVRAGADVLLYSDGRFTSLARER